MKIKSLFFKAFVLFGIILLSYTAFEKIINYAEFLTNLSNANLFNHRVIKPIGFTVILLEIITTIFLIFKERIGIYLMFFFFLFSTAYIFILQTEGNYIRCGCGGILNTLNYPEHMAINIAIIFTSLIYLKK